MKMLKIITHPLTIIISFLLILISGEHLGGFYLHYILIALPYGSIHAILATVGIVILLFTNYTSKKSFNYWVRPLLNIVGVIMLPLSLFLFFYRDKDNYNIATFYQTVPVIILSVFGLLAVIFLINNIIQLFRKVAT